MNKRIIVNRQKRRKRRQMMIRNILRVAVPTVLLSLLICFLIWKFVLPGNGSGGSADESQEVLLGDEYETVTGAGTESESPAQAVRMPLKGPRDDAKTTILTPGWHDDKTGRWYQNPDRTYFSDGFEEIDGVQYYFDRDGYLRTGWVSIGDKDYYFNADGSYNRDRKRAWIALTFNGGPSAHTEEILDVLEENEVHATFFVKGQMIAGHEKTLERMVELGCEIGSNSWDDLQLNLISMDEVVQKFRDTDNAIQAACGKTAGTARAPYAMATEDIYQTVGKPFFTWSLDVEDGEKMNAKDEIEAVLEADLEDGSIILMHDIFEPSKEAVKEIVPALVEKGYKLVTISELAEAKEVELQNTVYNDFHQSTLESGKVPGYLHNNEITAELARNGL